MRTFKQALKAGRHDGRTTQYNLQNVLLAYRTAPHATTRAAPCTLFLGRCLRTRLDLVRPDLEQRVAEKQSTQKCHHDQHAGYWEFGVGQSVLVRNMHPGPDWIPGVILSQLGPVTYLVDLGEGRSWKRHVDHLKRIEIKPPTQCSDTLAGSPEEENWTPSSNATSGLPPPSGEELSLPSEPVAVHPSTSSPTPVSVRRSSRQRKEPDRYEDTDMCT